MLPPVIVHPDGVHVRDIALYCCETSRVAATCRISGWGWHCAEAMVRTGRVEWIDEAFDGDGYNVDELKELGAGCDSAAGPLEPNAIPLVNCMAVHHCFDNPYPTHREALDSAIKNRKKLMNHPLFAASVKKMQTEPLVRTFFLTYSDSIGLTLRKPALA